VDQLFSFRLYFREVSITYLSKNRHSASEEPKEQALLKREYGYKLVLSQLYFFKSKEYKNFK